MKFKSISHLFESPHNTTILEIFRPACFSQTLGLLVVDIRSLLYPLMGCSQIIAFTS